MQGKWDSEYYAALKGTIPYGFPNQIIFYSNGFADGVKHIGTRKM